jgi:Fur family ferric uptake transcriptional regulator
VLRQRESIDAALRTRGIRLTGARKRILEAVVGLRGHWHFTVEELLERMRKDGVAASKATLYRTLSILVDIGAVEPREFERGQLRYEVVAGEDHHDHMICTSCGAVHEFVDDEIERRQQEAARKFGFRMMGHSHRIFGLCARCDARGAASPTGLSASPPPSPGSRGPRRARPA